MKIAQIAPPWITLPPKNYGGTESVLSTLVEQQVAQGHDVTLFAAGDAKTSAKLVSFFPTSLLQEGVSCPFTISLKLNDSCMVAEKGVCSPFCMNGLTRLTSI